MNIDDVTKIPEIEGHVLDNIFALQRELIKKYEPIEKANGAIVPDPDETIDSALVQMRIKDMFWRTVEELAEAVENLDDVLKSVNVKHNNWNLAWDTSPDVRHFFEELIDALHFLTEASIVSGVSPDSLKSDYNRALVNHQANYFMARREVITDYCWVITGTLGLAANCLKNKPWKQTQIQTDRTKFRVLLIQAWEHFFNFWSAIGAGETELFALYFRKNEVNKFRQRSKY